MLHVIVIIGLISFVMLIIVFITHEDPHNVKGKIQQREDLARLKAEIARESQPVRPRVHNRRRCFR